jgi:hypothetical protein
MRTAPRCCQPILARLSPRGYRTAARRHHTRATRGSTSNCIRVHAAPRSIAPCSMAPRSSARGPQAAAAFRGSRSPSGELNPSAHAYTRPGVDRPAPAEILPVHRLDRLPHHGTTAPQSTRERLAHPTQCQAVDTTVLVILNWPYPTIPPPLIPVASCFFCVTPFDNKDVCWGRSAIPYRQPQSSRN